MTRIKNFEIVKDITQYFSEIKHIPTLSKSEERELGEKIKLGDKNALNKLIEHNLRFVVTIAKKYRGMGIPFEDIISEGNMGLIHAAKRYDGSKDVRFISYAIWWIKYYISEAIKNNPTDEINVDDYTYDNKTHYEKQTDFINKDFENELTLLSDRNASVEELLDCLQERERKIIVMFYGLNGSKEMNLDEIGEAMKVSNERVRQIKDIALIKLKTNVLMKDHFVIKELKELR